MTLPADRSALIRARTQARTTEEILEALACIEWANAHRGAICPPGKIPTAAQLGEWPFKKIDDDAQVMVLHGFWQKDSSQPHPLAVPVRQWQNRPRRIERESRQDLRILPDIRESIPAGFLDIVAAMGEPADETPHLPDFEADPGAPRVPLLDIVDMSGTPVMAKGPGLPLPARMMVYALLLVPPNERDGYPVEIQVTLRDVAARLWPGGWKSRYKTVMAHAVNGLDRHWMVLPDGETLWRPVMARSLNRLMRPDTPIIFSVAYPPGARKSGPPVSLPDLWTLAAQSATRCRAYLSAHTLNWRPGATRVPVGNGRFRVWSKQVARYPALSRADRRRLAFGPQDTKHRTHREIDAPWQDLPGLVWTPTGDGGARLLPDAIAEGTAKSNCPNRGKSLP